MWIIAHQREKQYSKSEIPEFGYGNDKCRFWGQTPDFCPEFFLKGSRNS